MPAIFVLADDVAMFLYAEKKTIVVSPFKIQSIRDLILAENAPSACAMQVDETTEDKIGRSHLIFESKSMGLLMRYILEREYDIELDFSDSVPIREKGVESIFNFISLDQMRKEKADDMNNGTIRATIDGNIHIYDEGGVFSQERWEPIFGVMTNTGLFRYQRTQKMRELPKIMRIHQLKLTALTGQKLAGRNNVFKLDYINDKGKVSHKYFSVDDFSTYKRWLAKVEMHIAEYAQFGDRILIPKELRAAEDLNGATAPGGIQKMQT